MMFRGSPCRPPGPLVHDQRGKGAYELRLELFGDHRGQGAESPAPVADFVLLLGRELGVGAGLALCLEDRVVAETTEAAWAAQQAAAHLAAHQMLAVAVTARQDQRGRADERGCALV